MSDKKRLMLARFPYLNQENPEVTDYLVKTVIKARAHPAIGDVKYIRPDDTPITMTRNRALQLAQECEVDYLLMIDSDMAPDDSCSSGKEFFTSSLEFMLRHAGPCVVAAPYCGPPPESPVYMFKWTSGINLGEQDNAAWKLEMFGREEATMWRGIVEVAAAPTGLILIDMAALAKIEPPYFAYEYTDKYEHTKSTTEDVYFTRNLSLAGVPVYANWDCWAGHWKRYKVRRPVPLFPEDIRADLARRLQHPYSRDQILEQVHVEDGVITHGIEANPRIRAAGSDYGPTGHQPHQPGRNGCAGGDTLLPAHDLAEGPQGSD